MQQFYSKAYGITLAYRTGPLTNDRGEEAKGRRPGSIPWRT